MFNMGISSLDEKDTRHHERSKEGPMLHVQVVEHPFSQFHKLVKVEARGRVYAATWAAPFPTETEVKEVWRYDRKIFWPYDPVRQRYTD